MTYAITVWLILTLVLGGLALIAVWARRRTLYRGASIAVMIPAALLAGPLVILCLGWSVPIIPGYTSFAEEDARVLGHKLVAGEAIYVLVDVGPGEPRYFRIPWDTELAETLQNLADDPNSGGVMMAAPFEPSWETRPQFYELPQPKTLPDKPQPTNVPHFEQSV